MVGSRRDSNRVVVGDVPIGAGAPVSVQSMTSTDTADVEATSAQLAALAGAGCEIARVAIPSSRHLDAFEEICRVSPLPIVADVHFDASVAVRAAHAGASKLRINPGNIGDLGKVDEVIDAAGEARIPIRIGVNAGSLAADYADRDWPLAEKLAASAVAFSEHFEGRGFHDIVVSAKASSVRPTIDAYRRLATEIPYALHLGITEAGPGLPGIVRSSVGIGALLEEGIGDTLRVSLTGDPAQEIDTAWEILAALDIRRRGPELIACPTCGRCDVDLARIAEEVSVRLRALDAPLKVAIMGCVVNGPGEAREADVGLAAGRGSATLFVRGTPLRKVPEERMVDELMAEVERLARTE